MSWYNLDRQTFLLNYLVMNTLNNDDSTLEEKNVVSEKIIGIMDNDGAGIDTIHKMKINNPNKYNSLGASRNFYIFLLLSIFLDISMVSYLLILSNLLHQLLFLV